MKKLSFSFSSSTPAKPTLNILLDQSSSSSSSSSAKKAFVTGANVIIPLANEWAPQKKAKNTNVSNKYEVANIPTVIPINPSISNDLNIRSKKDFKRNSQRKVDRYHSNSSTERLILEKLRNDLDNLLDHRGMDEYEDMPVENFAAALLKGYGWHEGRGVGKNAKEDVGLFEINQRNGREGLGFVNNNMPKSPKTIHDNSKSWLHSHIRVRIISKELEGARRLFLKKGEIVDVVDPTSCDICIDDSEEIIQGVDEDFLETALPRRGARVLVLCGRYKSVYGSLLEKDMDNEIAIVCDEDTC
ncbi:protein MOS2-like [Bidens hawaiensis]|uniref:protein MOS2-like n=1 Tax=Bidens hawaiensis TaxID=980011 RepID=UPI00404985B6